MTVAATIHNTQKRNPPMKRTLIAAAVILGAGLTACTAQPSAVTASPDGTVITTPPAAGAATASPAVTVPPATAPPATAPPTAPPDTTLAASKQAWATAHLGSLRRLAADLSDVSTKSQAAQTTLEFSPVSDACRTFQTDVRSALAWPTFPDADVAAHFRTGLSLWAAGAADCISGVASVDATQIERAANEFTQGGSEIDAANAALTAAS